MPYFTSDWIWDSIQPLLSCLALDHPCSAYICVPNVKTFNICLCAPCSTRNSPPFVWIFNTSNGSPGNTHTHKHTQNWPHCFDLMLSELLQSLSRVSPSKQIALTSVHPKDRNWSFHNVCVCKAKPAFFALNPGRWLPSELGANANLSAWQTLLLSKYILCEHGVWLPSRQSQHA